MDSNIQLSLGSRGIFLVSQEVEGVPDPVLNVVQQVGLRGVAVLRLGRVVTLHFRCCRRCFVAGRNRKLFKKTDSNEISKRPKKTQSFETDADVASKIISESSSRSTLFR